MATTDKLMTADELLRLPDDGQRHELIAGELRTMAPSGGEHGGVAMNLSTPLDQYVRANHLGRVYAAATITACDFLSHSHGLIAVLPVVSSTHRGRTRCEHWDWRARFWGHLVS